MQLLLAINFYHFFWYGLQYGPLKLWISECSHCTKKWFRPKV